MQICNEDLSLYYLQRKSHLSQKWSTQLFPTDWQASFPPKSLHGLHKHLTQNTPDGHTILLPQGVHVPAGVRGPRPLPVATAANPEKKRQNA